MTFNSTMKSLSPLVVGTVFASTSNSEMGYPLNFACIFNVMGILCLGCFWCKFIMPKKVQG